MEKAGQRLIANAANSSPAIIIKPKGHNLKP
jgi:hypothetical protein